MYLTCLSGSYAINSTGEMGFIAKKLTKMGIGVRFENQSTARRTMGFVHLELDNGLANASFHIFSNEESNIFCFSGINLHLGCTIYILNTILITSITN